MTRTELMLEGTRKLFKVVGDIRSLADSVQELCLLVSDNVQEVPPETMPEEVPKMEEKAEPEIPLEKVRGILAEKSRAGHTAEVRAIIQKYGADRLSDLDPKDYAAVLKEAEVL